MNTDGIIKALLENRENPPPEVANNNTVTSEQLENELAAQQARIEKSFKDALSKLEETINKAQNNKGEKNNEENNRNEQGTVDERGEIHTDSVTGNESN